MQQRKKPTHGKTTASVPASAPPAPHSVSLLDPSILNSFFPIFFFLLVPRFLAANRAPISDCDETFNFWEAVHHLTFSGGQQTWEHAPQFALRSWLYAGAHAALFRIVGLFIPWMSSPASFWFMSRFALAAISAAVEAFAAAVFLRQCGKMNRIDPNNNRMICGYLAVAFLATSPGLFSHQISLLPTTTAASLLLLSTSLTVFDAKYFALVPLLSGIAILLAWPFACVAFVPILMSTLHHYTQPHLGLQRIAYRAVFAAVTILASSTVVDTLMYGRVTSSLFNLVAYNVFGADGGSSAMYGTEPWYWYLMNGFVNLGITWPFVLAAPAVCVIAAGRPFSAGKAWRLALAKGPIVLPPALWTAFLSLLPHKEERFLAVVFPIACFTAADCISQLLDIAQRVFPRFLKPALLICLSSFTALAMLLGALRCAAIVSNYGASLAIWASVSTLPAAPGTIVCVGKEWYRFHSSFLLPHGATLGYLQSTFTGQLPQPFATTPVSTGWWRTVSSATRALRPNFNAVNKEEPSRYVNVTSCNYIVDLDGPWQGEEHYPLRPDFAVVASLPFMRASATPPLLRWLWMPPGVLGGVVSDPYLLLERNGNSASK